jgi:pyridoxine 4-dehydrogenase
MVDLQHEGKVRMIGVSNVNVEELRRAQAVTTIASVQNRASLDDRSSDDILAICKRDGIAFLPWAPLDGGDLTRAQALEAIAAAHGATTAQVALAWLLARSPSMLPIPGTSSVAHLEENVGAAALRLTADELARIG